MDSWWFVRTVRFRGCTFPRNLMEFEVWNSSPKKINTVPEVSNSFTHFWGCLHFQPHQAHASYPKNPHRPSNLRCWGLPIQPWWPQKPNQRHWISQNGTDWNQLVVGWLHQNWLVGYIRIGWVHCQSVDDSNLILKIEKYVVYVGFVFHFWGGLNFLSVFLMIIHSVRGSMFSFTGWNGYVFVGATTMRCWEESFTYLGWPT